MSTRVFQIQFVQGIHPFHLMSYKRSYAILNNIFNVTIVFLLHLLLLMLLNKIITIPGAIEMPSRPAIPTLNKDKTLSPK